jgi:hypothetical protein
MTFKQINALSEDALLYNPKTWCRLLIAEVMTLTERSPKFKTCEVSQVASKGHPPGQSARTVPRFHIAVNIQILW